MELDLAMRKIVPSVLAALVLAVGSWLVWTTDVAAQCTGVFPPNTLCGNLSVSPQPPAAFTSAGTIAGPGSSTANGLPIWSNTLGTQLKDANGLTIAGNYTFGGAVTTSNWADVRTFGAKCDGSTDDTTAVQNAISAVNAAGGGTVGFPAGVCKIAGQITIPNDGGSSGFEAQAQHNLRLTGVGGGTATSARTGPPNAASILNMTYSSTNDCKLCTLGLGALLIDNLGFFDSGSDTTPFILDTNTTMTITQASFVGSNNASQTCIVLGGTSTTIGNTTNSAFQGYGTTITRNQITGCGIGILFQTFVNGVVVSDNEAGKAFSGSVGFAFVKSAGNVALPNQSNVISNNTIEMTFYVHGIYLDMSQFNTMLGNGFYDAGGSTTDYYFVTNSSTWNIIGASSGIGIGFIKGDTASLVQTTLIGDNQFAPDFAYPTYGHWGTQIGNGVRIGATYDVNGSSDLMPEQLVVVNSSGNSATPPALRMGVNNSGSATIEAYNAALGAPNIAKIALNKDATGTQGFVGVRIASPGHPLDVNGEINTNTAYFNSGSAPGISSCGTSPSVAAGSNSSGGVFTTGTSLPTACTLTFAVAYPNNSFCAVSPANAAARGISGGYSSSSNQTTIGLTLGAGTNSASFNYVCNGN